MSRATVLPHGGPASPPPASRLDPTEERETPDIETSSEGYAKRFADPVGAWFLRTQEQTVLRMLSPWPGATILEVGGGHGQLTEALIRQGHRVVVLGSDRSCQRRIQPMVERGQCRFVTGNLLALPYTSQAFDVVIGIRLLPHVRRWGALITELSRVARHAVVVDYPTVRSLNCLTPAFFSAKRRLEGNTRPYTLFRDGEVVCALAGHSFRLKTRAPEFFLPMALHRALGRPSLSTGLERVCGALQLTRWLGSPVLALFTRQR